MRSMLMFLLMFLLGACATPAPDTTLEQQEDVLQQMHALGGGSSRQFKKAYLSLAFEHVCPPVPVPGPSGWGPSDQAGNTNTQGPGTACRAGLLQALAVGELYRVDHVFDDISPSSPFGAPLTVTPSPTFCLEPPLFPYATKFCGHSETLSGDFGGQGTQLDFFGHAGRRPDPAGGPETTVFYNGFTAPEVQAGALGADQVKPLATIGILLDARKLNGGVPLGPTDVVTKANVWQMMADQDLLWLGFKPGMVVFIYTGKRAGWESDPLYYLQGPGLAADVVTDIYLPNHIVYHGLDNPFSDQADLIGGVFASGNDPLDPFPIHTTTLSGGILQSQNLNLEQLAADEVYLFSLYLGAPRIRGAKGAMVSPVVYGAPW